MNFTKKITLTQTRDTLVLTSKNTQFWLGFVFFCFCAFMISRIPLEQNMLLSEKIPALLLCGTIGVFSFYMMLPQEFVTVFDLKGRCVTVTNEFAWGFKTKANSYPYKDIAGIGVEEVRGETYNYRVALRLRDGEVLRLSCELTTRTRFDEIAKRAARGAGLQLVLFTSV